MDKYSLSSGNNQARHSARKEDDDIHQVQEQKSFDAWFYAILSSFMMSLALALKEFWSKSTRNLNSPEHTTHNNSKRIKSASKLNENKEYSATTGHSQVLPVVLSQVEVKKSNVLNIIQEDEKNKQYIADNGLHMEATAPSKKELSGSGESKVTQASEATIKSNSKVRGGTFLQLIDCLSNEQHTRCENELPVSTRLTLKSTANSHPPGRLVAQYHLRVENHSLSPGCVFCVFQKPKEKQAGFMTLAWLVEGTDDTPSDGNSTKRIAFCWSETHSIFHQEVAKSDKGAQNSVFSSLGIPANPTSGPRYELLRDGKDIVLQASAAADSGVKNRIHVYIEGNVPERRVAVGVGMSGSPYVAMSVYPGMHYTFHTDTQYYLGYGSYTKGKDIDFTFVTIDPLLLDFPRNVHGHLNLSVRLSELNTWSIRYDDDEYFE